MRNKRFYYLLSLFFAFALPAIVEGFFIIKNINVFDLVIFIFGIFALGSIWDIWATRHGRNDSFWLWQFNFSETLGIKILGLPVEEYLFYIFSSTYIVFSREATKLASQAGDLTMKILIPLLGLWTLLVVLIPIIRRSKGDRLIN